MDRVILQTLNMTTVGSHSYVGSQTLNEVSYRLVDVFLWQLFPDGLQGDFNSSVVLGLGWGLFCYSSMVLQMGRVQIWRVSMNPREFACSNFCMTLEVLKYWGLSSLKEHNFVIFKYISTKLFAIKCIFYCLTVFVKFHAKICMHC